MAKKKTTKTDNSPNITPISAPVPVMVEAPKPVVIRDDRVPTGIPGFDELIEGGIPKGKKVLIEGKAGTGKSIFAIQYLYNGATKYNEPGLYLTFEQKDSDIKEQAKQFGWDLDAAGVEVIYKSPSRVRSVHEILQILYHKFEKKGIKRLVIDSLPALYINAVGTINDDLEKKGFFKPKEEKLEPKVFLYMLLDILKFVPVTTILITEDIETQPELGFTPEYISDGVISIQLEPIGEYARNLIVKKMRYTKNNTNPQPVEITDKGMVIHTQ